jgi:hypothetical protein
MAAPTLLRRELKNARMYFIPSGETVDAVTVANATWPDNNPPTNWTAYEIPEIEDVKEENTVKKESFTIPDAGGGYREEEEEMVTRRMWKASTHKTSIYLKKLQHGLATVPTVGTAIAPGTAKDNYMDGVLLLEIQNKAGTVIERTQVWARLRLVTAGDVGPVTAKVEISLEQLPSTLNSYVAVA